MLITAEKFESRVGCKPEQDDLERCNCNKAGQIGHEQCGWDKKRDMPVFVPGGWYVPNVKLTSLPLTESEK